MTIDGVLSQDDDAEESPPDDVASLVRRLLQTLQDATTGLPRNKAECILEASELFAVTALHQRAAALEAIAALERASRSFDVDALTGLPNRLLFRDRFSQALAHAKRRNARVAVLFVDLDGFKEINDAHGHSIGDEMLRHAAQCLLEAKRDVDTVCRHGGDEFLILLSDVADITTPALFAEKALAAIDMPLRIGDAVVRVGASIGISIYPDDGADQETLIREADAAMYAAKRSGSKITYASTPALANRVAAATPLSNAAKADPVDLLERSLHEAHAGLADLKSANERLSVRAITAEEGHRVAESARRHQAELLHLVAHELRNALAPLQSAAEVLGLLQNDTSLLPRLELILTRQILHMGKLLTDILDVSRINNGRIDVRHEHVDLRTIVSDAESAVGDALAGRAQKVMLTVDATPLMIHGDAARLRDVVTTLVSTASQDAPDGATISVSVTRRPEQGVITVDYPDCSWRAGDGTTPVGLAAATPTMVTDGDGLTFSLFVVMEFIRLHGGRLTLVRDLVATRSRVEVTLPLTNRG